jgi:hypothetical protein
MTTAHSHSLILRHETRAGGRTSVCLTTSYSAHTHTLERAVSMHSMIATTTAAAAATDTTAGATV